MDGVRELLEQIRRHKCAEGNFRGLLNVLIGRRVEDAQGTLVSPGLAWRAVAAWLKKVRWPREAVRELGLDTKALPPRDRERFWYAAIAQAHVDSPEATGAGDRLAEAIGPLGYRVGPPPAQSE
jgi:hypothetical protein